eukprot:CAMPEP_0167804504 /NCGR_PEP_ID=MMETSP0111_2-20121227/20526_1 /TAXON_ID=91324 /ORGANISM="Lotharella globosa, Strain CCCM811" /LENGTH=106 /DNA_ID=CAMNT_0007701287 /DNA_START=137 /DNA_END=457 /DNA_ORIENTATION=+
MQLLLLDRACIRGGILQHGLGIFVRLWEAPHVDALVVSSRGYFVGLQVDDALDVHVMPLQLLQRLTSVLVVDARCVVPATSDEQVGQGHAAEHVVSVACEGANALA